MERIDRPFPARYFLNLVDEQYLGDIGCGKHFLDFTVQGFRCLKNGIFHQFHIYMKNLCRPGSGSEQLFFQKLEQRTFTDPPHPAQHLDYRFSHPDPQLVDIQCSLVHILEYTLR